MVYIVKSVLRGHH